MDSAVIQSIYDLICQKSRFESLRNTAVSAAILFLAVYVIDVIKKAGASLLRHEPTFFCSLLVKSESTWLRSEDLKIEAPPFPQKK